MRKVEWKPLATKHLANRKVVLHSDGALAYKLKVPGVMHCNVVDKKKQVKANGKAGRYVKTNVNNQKTMKTTTGSLGEAALHEGLLLEVAHRRPSQSQEWHSNYQPFWGLLRSHIKRRSHPQ